MSTVLIAGGTGLVGTRLSHLLKAQNYEVIHLSRKENLKAEFPAYRWDLNTMEIDKEAWKKTDYILNLAGTGIADKRWTKTRKKAIIDSRVKSNALIEKYIREYPHQPKAYIAAAAIGYYGNTGEQWLDETSTPDNKGFLSKSCIEWEKSIQAVAQTGIRTVWLRVGIVLSTLGGALAKMLPSYKLRVGAYFGDGQQYYSWIHIDDMCKLFIAAIENEQIQGVYNGVAPNPERNKDFAYKIAEALDQKAFIAPSPALALRLAMGEMADVVLHGNRCSAKKISATGFEFDYPQLIPALKDIIKRKI